MPENMSKDDKEPRIDGEKEKIQALMKVLDRDKQYRKPFEQTMQMALSFLIGKQYVRYNPSSRKLENLIREELMQVSDRKARLTTNRILPIYRQKFNHLIGMNLISNVIPATKESRDLKAAHVGNVILRYQRRKVQMEKMKRKLYSLMLTFGWGCLFPFWNPTKGDPINVPQEEMINGKRMMTGDVDLHVLTPFEVYFPNCSWATDPNRVIICQAQDVDEARSIYGDRKLQPEDNVEANDTEAMIKSLLDEQPLDSGIEQNKLRIFQDYQAPDDEYPNGRLMICTAEKVIFEGDLPSYYKGRIPVYKADYFELPMTIYSMGLIEPLISPQKSYNLTTSLIIEHIKKMPGKWLLPYGMEMKEPINDRTAQFIYYDGTSGLAPQRVGPQALPASMLNEPNRIIKDMEDIAASHDVSHSRVPGGVKSGKAIGLLQEADAGQSIATVENIKECFKNVCETFLDMTEAMYIEPRTLTIVGDGERHQLPDFKGDQLAGEKNVDIQLGTSSAFSQIARNEQIREDVKFGIISIEEAREKMQYVKSEDFPEDPDIVQIQAEIEAMLRGEFVSANEFDNHAKHIKHHNNVRKDPEFQKNAPAEVKALFAAHDQMHKMYYSRELAAQQPQPQPQPAQAAPR